MPKYSITSHSGAILSIINNQYLSLTSPALNETQQTGWTTAETNHLDEANLSAIPTHAIENKIKRDSNNLAHLTVIDPITFSQLQKAWKRGDIKVDSVNSEQIQVDEQKENVGADASNSKIDETDTCNDESSSSKKKVKKPKKKQSETPTPKIPSIPFEVWILSHFDADKLDDWTDLGLGTCTSSKDKSHRCWFKVIYHPSVSVARSAILSHLPNFTEQSLWFGHLTIGFIPKDVHDKLKTTVHLLPVTSASESHLDELSQICVEIAKHVTKSSTNSRTITAVLALSNHILNIQPENASALISRSHCHLVLGKVDEAIADAKLLYSRQSLIGFLRYAAAMKVMGDTDALVRVCWKCIFKMESNEWVTNNKEGLRDTMIKHLRKVIEEHGEIAGRIDTQISDDVEKSSPNQLVVPDIERVDFCFEQDELKTLYFTTLDLIKRQLKYTGTDAVSTSPIRVYCHSFGGKEWYRLPRNFSSLVPFQLYGSSTPRRQEDITEFANVGLTTVITLTKEEPLPAGWFTDRIRNVFIPVENYKPTTINQTNKAIWEIYIAQIQGGSSLVHCGGGKGRAGTVLGCYLLRFGVAPIGSLCEKCEKFSGKGEVFVRSNECSDGEKCASAQPPVMSAESAIEMIRSMRSGSIETKEQETFVREYASWVWKNCEIGLKANDLEPDVVANDEFEEETHLSCEGEAKLGSVVILVGLPGSGKTTFSKSLAERNPDITVIHKDELASSSKSSFETVVSTSSRTFSTMKPLLIDCCNPTMESRNMIFSLLFNPADAICVYFDVDPERCEKRALNRIGHPKLKGERRVKSAIDHFRKSMEPPQLSEGFKGIWTIKTFKDADTLIEKWSKKANGVASSSTSSNSSGAKTIRLPNFFKFPRTEHLFNTGSATDDDLVHFSNTESIDDLLSHFMSQFTTSSSSTTGIERKLTIEEKIDGANLGITAYRKKHELGWKLKVQNRSHYVNSKSHAQFGTLDRWIEQHREELLHLLVRAEKRGEEASESFGTIAVQNSDEEEISDFILFGEWCRATHSIHYDSLPDEFIAFDLFDCNRQRYVGRSDFHSMIEKTTINTVPVIFQQTDNQEDVDFMQSLRKKAGWFQLLEGKSKYRVDGGLEGVYLRVDERDNEEVRWWNRDRLKLVRSDFIAGNEHWSKGIFTKNIVIYN